MNSLSKLISAYVTADQKLVADANLASRRAEAEAHPAATNSRPSEKRFSIPRAMGTNTAPVKIGMRTFADANGFLQVPGSTQVLKEKVNGEDYLPGGNQANPTAFNAKGIFEGVETWKLAAIGAGVLVVIGGILYFLRK
jgi:hypothetical protein